MQIGPEEIPAIVISLIAIAINVATIVIDMRRGN